MPLYESVFIARQDISSSQAEGLMDSFAEIISNTGGSVSKKEYWGLRNLAYRIKKNRKGHYALLNIDAPAEAIFEMERNMRLHDDILRYLTVKVDELSEEPSPILRSREERGGRGGRGRRDFGDRPPRRDDRPSSSGSSGDGDGNASASDSDDSKDAKQGDDS